jgi:predicted metal-binding membrane protein
VDGAGPFREDRKTKAADVDIVDVTVRDLPNPAAFAKALAGPRVEIAGAPVVAVACDKDVAANVPSRHRHLSLVILCISRGALPVKRRYNLRSMRARSSSLFVSLLLVSAVCLSWIAILSRGMYGPMHGASAWMMTPQWDLPHLGLLWLMWAVMMSGMMLPSATPMILLVGGRAGYLVALGYLSVWAAFSVGATALQWLSMRLLIMTPMMEISNRWAVAMLLAFAGLYELTPLKQACLTTCQSPMAFLTRRWRGGPFGAFRMGIEPGVYCVGCCWALMTLLFAGGVMNPTVIAGLALLVAFEKLVPLGVWAPRVAGVALVTMALWVAFSGYL